MNFTIISFCPDTGKQINQVVPADSEEQAARIISRRAPFLRIAGIVAGNIQEGDEPFCSGQMAIAQRAAMSQPTVQFNA